MSEKRYKGNSVPAIIFSVVLLGVLGYGMAQPKPKHDDHGSGHSTSEDPGAHGEEHQGEGGDHGAPDEQHGGAPTMEISHAPGDVHDSAGHLSTSPNSTEPTTAPAPGAAAPATEPTHQDSSH